MTCYYFIKLLYLLFEQLMYGKTYDYFDKIHLNPNLGGVFKGSFCDGG